MKSKLPSIQWAAIGVVAVGIPLSAWDALVPGNTWLQVGPVVILLLAAPKLLGRWPLEDKSVLCVAGFLLLHLVAARWTYSDVPYAALTRPFGLDLNSTLGFHRNMFDRLVHFAFGALMVVPIADACQRHFGRASAIWQAVLFVFAISAAYEIFEWMLAVFMDPAAADAYNGQQGDVFDSPKDMAMAGCGALLVALPLLWSHRSSQSDA